MGYCLHSYLNDQGTVNTLKMALKNRKSEEPLIHYPNRGVQYCSYDYTSLLRKHNIVNSMTKNDEAYEDPIAERQRYSQMRF